MRIIAFVIGISINAVILRMIVRWTVKFTLPLAAAFWVEFFAAIVGVLIDLIMPMVGLSVLTNAVVVAGIYGTLIKDPNTVPIGFINGLIVLTCQILLFALIAGGAVVIYRLVL